MKSFGAVLVAFVCYQLGSTTGYVLPIRHNTTRSEDRFRYVPDIADALLRMADTDSNGAISNDEIRVFLAIPVVPEFLSDILTSDSVQTIDVNQNGLEGNELQLLLTEVLSTLTVSTSFAVIDVLVLETRLMIQRQEITIPQTSTEIAQTALDILDSNNNSKLSLDEVWEFFSVTAEQSYFHDVLSTAATLDTNTDMQLNLQEIIAVYEEMVGKHGSVSITPLVFYGRMKSLLGQVPDVWK